MLRTLTIAIGITAIVFGGCRQSTRTLPSATSDSDHSTAVTVQLNWYPEAEHGGVYQAKADGTYTKANLNVEIRPGGRVTPVAPELELGRVQFAFANADDVVVYRRQGMDIVAVLAAMQNNPRCILVRQDSGVKSLDELAGMTLQCAQGRPYLQFIRSRGLLEQVKEVPYHGSVSSLVGDPKIAIQAYSFAEPLLAEEQGVKVRKLMVSDLGWNPYSSVLITTGEMVREQPELVRQFVTVTQRGWQKYLTDPAQGNAAILEANEHGMTAKALEFGSNELRPLAQPEKMPASEVGKMTLERWQKLVKQMDQLEPDAAGKVKPEECFTVEFLGDAA